MNQFSVRGKLISSLRSEQIILSEDRKLSNWRPFQYYFTVTHCIQNSFEAWRAFEEAFYVLLTFFKKKQHTNRMCQYMQDMSKWCDYTKIIHCLFSVFNVREKHQNSREDTANSTFWQLPLNLHNRRTKKDTITTQKIHVFSIFLQVTETRTGPLGCSNYDNLDTVSSVLVHSPENKVQLQGNMMLPNS